MHNKTTVTNPRIREARTAMVTAVAAALARQGVLFTLPPMAPDGGGPADDGGGHGGRGCPAPSADDAANMRTVLMFASGGGRGGRA
jgi:hypothetical protein